MYLAICDDDILLCANLRRKLAAFDTGGNKLFARFYPCIWLEFANLCIIYNLVYIIIVGILPTTVLYDIAIKIRKGGTI